MSLKIDSNFSPMKFESPISDSKGVGTKTSINPKLKRKLDFSKNENAESLSVKQPATALIQPPPTLSGLYGSFFDQPYDLTDLHFVEIEENYQAIETQLGELSNPEFTMKVAEIRSYLKFLLDMQKNHDLLMAEIGILRFYLDSKIDQLTQISFNKFDTDQLLKHRSEQIKRELEVLEADYRTFVDDPQGSFAPSGKAYYLMRALVHMVILSNGDYNRGGLTATKLLVEDPNYPIAQELDADHALQVQNSVNQILKHSGFNSLFKKPIQIHSTLEDLIRYDLMLKINEKVKPPHVHLAVLLSLLRPSFQNDSSNCYAVATWHFLCASNPFQVYSKLLYWLSEGHISLPGCNFPIKNIIENRLSPLSDQLAATLKGATNQEPATFAFLRSRFECSSFFSLPDQTHTASAHLSGLPAARGLGSGLAAETLYFTFFESLLTNTVMSIIEFISLNGIDNKNINTKKYYISLKNNLVSKCIEHLFTGKDLNEKYQKIYKEKLASKLQQQIWLANICRPKLEYTKGQFPVKVNDYMIHSFSNGDVSSLIELIEEGVGVFSLIDNDYVQISSIKDLKNLLEDLIYQVAFDIDEVKNSCDISAVDKIIIHASKQANGDDFTNKIAKFISSQVNLGGVSPAAIKDADLLLFIQDGGNEQLIILDIFDLNPQYKLFRPANSMIELHEIIFELIEEIGEYKLLTTPKLLMSVSGDHVWTLNPSIWVALIDKIKDRTTFWKSYKDDPVQKKLSELKPGTNITWGMWRAKKLQKKATSPSKAAEAAAEVDQELSKVNLSTSDLKMIFSNFALSFPDTKIEEFSNSLGGSKQYPHQLAKKLRGFCLAEKISSPCVYALEIAISEQMSLPIEICLGDMNWGDKKENSSHTDLVIRWNWAIGDHELAMRNEEIEQSEPTFLSKKFSVYLPTFSPRLKVTPTSVNKI